MNDHDRRDRLDQLARELILKHNLRVRNHTAGYLLDAVARAEPSNLPVIGTDARTGVPRRVVLPISDLTSPGNLTDRY